jgi:hypothetical protein
LGLPKKVSEERNSGLKMNFFRESKKFWTKSALRLWKRFSGSGSTDRIEPMHSCIAENEKYAE